MTSSKRKSVTGAFAVHSLHGASADKPAKALPIDKGRLCPPEEALTGGYTITEASAIVGLTPRALRHYEQVGLIQPTRTRGKDRRYSNAMLTRLRVIGLLRKAAVPIPVIIETFHLPEALQPPRFDRLIRSRLVELKQEADLLERVLRTINGGGDGRIADA